jgi:hypothetical protein
MGVIGFLEYDDFVSELVHYGSALTLTVKPESVTRV